MLSKRKEKKKFEIKSIHTDAKAQNLWFENPYKQSLSLSLSLSLSVSLSVANEATAASKCKASLASVQMNEY